MMLTRESALALWDDLISEKGSFLCNHGELVLTRAPSNHLVSGEFGYFVRARNTIYTQEMFDAFNRVCAKHSCTYRIDTNIPQIIFYKPYP